MVVVVLAAAAAVAVEAQAGVVEPRAGAVGVAGAQAKVLEEALGVATTA